MKRKSKSNNNLIPRDDFCYEEEVEENGICETPVTGNMVAQFSFADNKLPEFPDWQAILSQAQPCCPGWHSWQIQ